MNRAQRRAAARRHKPLRVPEPVAEIELTAETWEAIADQADELLAIAEAGGVRAAEQWLRARGLMYRLLPGSLR